MKGAKKAWESYFTVLIVISIFMGVLMSFILPTIYGKDDEKCQLIDYTVEKVCSDGTFTRIEINNKAQYPLKLNLNERESSAFEVEKNTKQVLQIPIIGVDIRVVPVVQSGVETLQCRSKLKKVQETEIRRC